MISAKGVRRAAFILFLPVVAITSFSFGVNWERWRFEDSQLYWFGQYSGHLQDLVRQQRSIELSNDITYFNSKMRPLLNDREALQDGMYRLLGIGPYFRETAPVITNTPSSKQKPI